MVWGPDMCGQGSKFHSAPWQTYIYLEIKLGISLEHTGVKLLHTAIKLGHVGISEYLINCGCNVNAQTRRNKAAPLHYATYPSVPAIILDVLIDNGANVDIRDDDNATPFMWACYLNNTRAIKILLNRKADVLAVDNFGLSPLEWASHQGHLESVTLLIQSIYYSQIQLKSAYAQAVDSGQIKTAKALSKQLSQ